MTVMHFLICVTICCLSSFDRSWGMVPEVGDFAEREEVPDSMDKDIDKRSFFTGCKEIRSEGLKDGVYHISPDGKSPFRVYCKNGWTVIQRRWDYSDWKTSFYRNWYEYVQGFGHLYGAHWLGLENIHRLTKDGSLIHFDLVRANTWPEFVRYDNFQVHDSSTDYKMTVGSYTDGTIDGDYFSYHNNMKFSTYDRDNDASEKHCARQFTGAWWFNSCYKFGNLNGKYQFYYAGKNGTCLGVAYYNDKDCILLSKVQIKVLPKN